MDNVYSEKSIYKMLYSDKSEGKEFLIPRVFIIPKYQRTYKWDKGLCTLLFTDITSKKGTEYNFGFITLAQRVKLNEFDVIDGQQRIVSIHLLVNALYTVIRTVSKDSRDYVKMDKYFINPPTIYSNKEMSNSFDIIEKYRCGSITLDYLKTTKGNYNLNIINNFMLFVETIQQSLEGLNDNNKVNHINEYFNNLFEQRLFELNYTGNKSALESFISINMKSKQLDEFEVLSALLLSRLVDEKDITDYKDKLDEFIRKTEKIGTFKSGFKSYLTTLIWVQYEKYKYYCDNNSIIKDELRLDMPNHYVENVDFTPSQVMDFIDYLNLITNRYLLFIEKGDLSWILAHANQEETQSLSTIKRKIDNTEILTGLNNYKKQMYKILTVSERYIIALFVDILFGDKDNQSIIDILREIELTLLELHVYYLADNKPWKYEYMYLMNAKDLKTNTNDWLSQRSVDRERITNRKSTVYKNPDKRKVEEIAYLLPQITESKFYSLSMFYQTKSSIKNRHIDISSEVFITPLSDLNKEHFFIDNSRISKGTRFNILKSKSIIGINCFPFPSELNQELNQLGYKDFYNKANYIVSLPPIRTDKFHFIKVFSKLGLKVLEKITDERYMIPMNYQEEINKMSRDRYLDMTNIYKSNVKIDEENITDFLLIHLLFLEELRKLIINDFFEKIDQFVYSGSNIF